MRKELEIKFDETTNVQLMVCADCGGWVNAEDDAIPTVYRCEDCGRWTYGSDGDA